VLSPRRPTISSTQFVANLSTVSGTSRVDGEPTNYAPDDLVPGPSMLKRIVSELGNVGTTFILPLADTEAMQQLARPLRSLVSIGVKPEFVIDACTKNPDLFRNLTTKGDDAWQILNVLVDSCGMTYEDSLRMFASYGDDLLVCSPIGVQSRLDVLVASGIPAGRSCGRIVRRCPAILFARDPKEMTSVAEALCGFFSRKEVSAIIQAVPEVLLKNIEELEEKYEYIFFQSIYATLTANQLPLRDVVPSTPCSAVSATVDPAMAMGSRLSADVATLVDRAMSIDEHLQSMPMPLTGWNDHQFRSQD
ncbi:hypothetical protein OSTOST_06394, partial [Ostertagia ostertagi]